MAESSPNPSKEDPVSNSKAALPKVDDVTLEMIRAHRGMMWTVVAKFGMDFTVGAAWNGLPGFLLIAYLCAFVIVELAIAYFVFRLARAIYGAVPGVICAALTLVPCLGVFVVLVLNGTTTDLVRKSGVKIGFMGATKAQLDDLIANHNVTTGDSPVP